MWLKRMVHAAEPTSSSAQLNESVRRAFDGAVSRHCPDIFKGKGRLNYDARSRAGLEREWYDGRGPELERRLREMVETEATMAGAGGV